MNTVALPALHLFIIIFLFECGLSILVCDNYQSFSNPNEQHCFEDGDYERNITEIVRNWGFKAEEHYVFTEDGYKILVLRAYKKITQHAPLIMGHGIAHNSLVWLVRKNKSLVYNYGMDGFDIWMINFRGTAYSKEHRYLRSTDKQYWRFSFHEMGMYDLPATVDLVRSKTGQKAVYIGYSMGTVSGYIYSIRLKKHAESNIMGMVSLAPVAYLKGNPTALGFVVPFTPLLKDFVYTFLHGEIYALPKRFFVEAWQLRINDFLRGFIFGFDPKQIDPPFTIFLGEIQDSIGVEVLTHFQQILTSGKFIEQDFGEKGNMQKYGSPMPSLYNLSQIFMPMIVFVANNDFISTVKNARHFYEELPASSKCEFNLFRNDNYTHVDIVEAKDIITYTVEPLKRALMKIINNEC